MSTRQFAILAWFMLICLRYFKRQESLKGDDLVKAVPSEALEALLVKQVDEFFR